MTQPQFEQLYNESRAKKGRHSVTFPLMKSKITKKAIFKDIVDQQGRPERIITEKPISKKVFDTNKFNELCQAVWEYYTNTKLKRISSEGKWRPGIGFIKSTNKGFADLHGLYNGRAIYIETKQEKEKHLQSQKDFAKWVHDGGGIYVSVRSFEDMYNVTHSIIDGKSFEEWEHLK